jgi:RimK-like ATP-grasp domain
VIGPRLVVIGLDSDPTLVHLAVEAKLAGIPLETIELREVVAEGTWRFAVPEDGSSFVGGPSGRVELGPATSVFARPIDLSSTQTGESHRRWRGLMEGLRAWLETTTALVINRPGGHEHNGSKPFHEQWLARQGFDVPPSITSSRREPLTDFAAAGPTIIKTCAGVRADARRVEADEFRQFEPEQGPVHLQRLVTGADVRAHVVGSEVLAVMIESDAIDYRTGSAARWSVYEPSDQLRAKMVRATRAMGLCLAGWDFKVDSGGRAWCLEANAMPGYSSYDRRLGGSISRAILNLMLTGS